MVNRAMDIRASHMHEDEHCSGINMNLGNMKLRMLINENF